MRPGSVWIAGLDRSGSVWIAGLDRGSGSPVGLGVDPDLEFCQIAIYTCIGCINILQRKYPFVTSCSMSV